MMNQKNKMRKGKQDETTNRSRIVFRVPEPFKVALDVHLAGRQERLIDFGIRAFKAQLKKEGAAA